MTQELDPVRLSPAPHRDADYAVSDATAQRVIDSVPANTRRSYDKIWTDFETWCATEGRTPLPATPQTLLSYVDHLIQGDRYHSPGSVETIIGAIRSKHRRNGYKEQPDTEAARSLLRDYKRVWADEGNRRAQAIPATVETVRAMVDTCDLSTAAGLRDRALLVIGFSIMARESEVAGLDIADVREDGDEGLAVYIRRSKTDQAAAGVDVAVPYGQQRETCPVRAWRDWTGLLTERGLVEGPLFRPIDRHGRIAGEPKTAGARALRLSGKSVSAIVHRRARLAGLPDPGGYSGHSLRSGGATSAYANGAPVSEIARHGRWSEKSPVVLGYIRAVDKWKNNPMKGIGL